MAGMRYKNNDQVKNICKEIINQNHFIMFMVTIGLLKRMSFIFRPFLSYIFSTNAINI